MLQSSLKTSISNSVKEVDDLVKTSAFAEFVDVVGDQFDVGEVGLTVNRVLLYLCAVVNGVTHVSDFQVVPHVLSTDVEVLRRHRVVALDVDAG